MSRIGSRICVGTLIGLSAAAEVPCARIPYDGAPVQIDGEIAETEWANAAIIHDIRPLGSAYAGTCRTEFRVKHDDEKIYVAVRCEEREAGYPISFPRTWDESFFRNDDCVEVVLGMPDPELRDRGAIDMGGYEHAMDTAVAAADFYYSFAVNASGSRQLCYNEMPVGDGGFESACHRGQGEWTVELAVPRTTPGLDTLAGITCCANLIRHRPPEMLGWHLPSFGGYAPMPFGQFQFLRTGETTSTSEPWPRDKPTPSPNAPISASIEYGPLNRVVVGTIKVPEDKAGLTVELAVEGLPLVRESLANCDARSRSGVTGAAYVVCDLPPGDQPERKATLCVLRNGTQVCRVEKVCPATKMPEWVGTKEASEYLREKIPAPWTMPVIEGHDVRLVDKTISFGGNGLPCAVVRTDALSTTFRTMPFLRTVVDGETVVPAFGEPVLTADANRVLVSATGYGNGIRIRVFAILDYDGFLDYTFAVEGERATSVERLELVLPLCVSAARNFLPGTLVQNGGALSNAGWRGAGCPFWIGNEQEGLSFNYDESPFRTTCKRSQLSVTSMPDGKDAVLVFTDAKGQLASGSTFCFFLQPTPTKPYPLKPVRNRYTWWWEGWSRFHGYPDISKTNEIRTAIAKVAQQDKKLILYCCQGLQENAPEMMAWRDDFVMKPDWCYYRWNDHNCFATCKRGPEGDFQLASWARLIRETGISGMMSDGLSIAWTCANPLHAHCSGRTMPPVVGVESCSRTIAQRNFLKRVRGLFDRTGKPFCMVGHTGGAIDPNTLGFFDAYFEGEQLSRLRRGYYPSRALFSVGYSGLPWGWRTIYWPKQLHNYEGMDSALCYALLHNSEFYVNHDIDPPHIDTDILEPFSTSDTVFRPYWKSQNRVTFRSNRALLSLYERTNAVLLIVGNLTPAATPYELDFSSLWPNESVHAEDLLLKHPIDGLKISETLAPHSCRIVKVSKGLPATDGTPVVTGRRQDGGSPYGRDSHVVATAVSLPKTNDKETLEGGTWSFKYAKEASVAPDGTVHVQAVPYTPEPVTAFNSVTFGRTLTVKGTLCSTERIRIGLGDHHFLSFGNGFPAYGWMFTGPTDPYGRGWVYPHVKVKRYEPVAFRLALTNGVLNVWYDQQRLVRDLKLEMAPSGNRFSIGTWHIDHFEFHPEAATPPAGQAEKRGS
ncbi:MAG: hypothetical protein IKR48_00855 [Kiritimatiellae bacterium]|nr:hypothetical protein [Kiritimatiellia bacterium]